MRKIFFVIITLMTFNSKAQTKGDTIFQHVEIESQILGGPIVWKLFLQANLNVDGVRDSLPRNVVRKGLKETAVVTFTVCTDGSICDIGIENEVNPIIKNEVLRVMKLSPKWEPGYQSGVAVKSRKKQSITFVINNN